MGRQGPEVGQDGIPHVVGLLGLFQPGVDFHGLDEAAQRDVVGSEPGAQLSDGLGGLLGLLPGVDSVLQDTVLPENLLQDRRTVGWDWGLVPGQGLVWGKQGPNEGLLGVQAMLLVAMGQPG